MRLKILVWLLIIANFSARGQSDSLWTSGDTLRATVRAYESNRPVNLIPAAINVVDQSMLQRFNNTSLLSAVNTQPGVRMEERSPGSYRLNMRGSTLRSPFGVRNVKIYLNEIPFTDPGGNAYLNQLSFNNVSSLEILKGPASSLYGAGTGGAMLIHTQPKAFEQKANIDLIGGSYQLKMLHASVSFGKDSNRNNIDYTHQQSDGWRDHTNMRRDIASYENQLQISSKQTLNTIITYGDLYYQTPGGLTKAQYESNPRAARPSAGAFPSAEQGMAAIYQKTFLAGFSNTYKIKSNWNNTTALYGAATWFSNPTFRLYEKRTEPHFGGRTVFTNNFTAGRQLFHVVYGAEAQKGIFSSQTFKNKNGTPDTILTNDEINNWRYSLFAQAEWLLPHQWNITGGLSYNRSYVSITRLIVYPVIKQERNFNSELAPRIALMKSFKHINIYASVSEGFSPPTTAELLPGTGVINTSLEAEHGINYEAGVKGDVLKSKLSYELAVYNFNLTNAISQRRDSSGGDYYVNAGKTKQQGIELMLRYKIINSASDFVRSLNVFSSYTYNDFSYKDYKVLTTDYSGNQLPSVPKHTLVLGLDAVVKYGFYANINFQYTDKIALNDANSDYASDYNLLSARVGYHVQVKKKLELDLFCAGDNLFNITYSLGNDINAAGGRYYNPAAGRNYVVGVNLKLQ